MENYLPRYLLPAAVARVDAFPLNNNGKIDFTGVHLGDVSTDCYALWKAVKELQTGEKQISLCELADSGIVSDNAFRLIVQAVTIARYGTAILTNNGGTI